MCKLGIMSLPTLRIVARIKPNDTGTMPGTGPVDSHLRFPTSPPTLSQELSLALTYTCWVSGPFEALSSLSEKWVQ